MADFHYRKLSANSLQSLLVTQLSSVRILQYTTPSNPNCWLFPVPESHSGHACIPASFPDVHRGKIPARQPNITAIPSRNTAEVLPDAPNIHLGHKLHWAEGCLSH